MRGEIRPIDGKYNGVGLYLVPGLQPGCLWHRLSALHVQFRSDTMIGYSSVDLSLATCICRTSLSKRDQVLNEGDRLVRRSPSM